MFYNASRFSSRARLPGFIILILLSAFNYSAQIDAQTSKSTVDNAEPYKYVVGENPAEFNRLLNYFGEQKYKLLSATKIPLKDSERSFEQMILAAVLKYDGEQTFKYELLVANNPALAETLINELAGRGFRYRKTFWFTDGIKDAPGCGGDVTEQILCSSGNSLNVGSLILMEQESGIKNARYYKVLAGEMHVFIWEKSTAATLREIFNETLKDSFFVPVGLFYYLLDNRDAIIVEIINDPEIVPEISSKVSYKIVRKSLGWSFNKEIKTLGEAGFRIIAKEVNFAVVGQTEENKTPVAYSLVAAHKKNHLQKISELAAQGARFSLVDFDHYEIDQFEGKLLFEKSIKGDGGRRFTYKAVRLTETPSYPNKTIKRRTLQPTSSAAMNEFNELIKAGYQARALYFSRALKGIAVLLEKEM